MDLIMISGIGTVALLLALFGDYILAEDSCRPAPVDGLPQSPGTESRVATQPSREDAIAYDRAA
jgi:hypothetical protein